MGRSIPDRLKLPVALFFIGLFAHPLLAQARTSDSVTADRRARRAQAEFEVRKRNYLPRAFFRPTGRCDETIGRWCYWYDDLVRNHEESGRLRDMRRTFIRSLDQIGSRFPGSDWISGQRVRYAIEARDDSAAIAVARACRGTRSWCHSLNGLALHAAGRYADAEIAFDSALRLVPPHVRCAWTDIGYMLEGDLAKSYRQMRCGERDEVERKIWWLADPLYSIPGNDRRTEHFSRAVMDVIFRDSRVATGVRWGPDNREVLVRYGWPEFWTLEPAPANSNQSLPSITEHQRTPSFHFFPIVRHPDSLATIRSLRFNTDHRKAKERYAPRYANSLVAMDPQIARFARGDSVLVIAGYDITGDTAFKSSTVRAALVAAGPESGVPAVTVSTAASRRHAMSLRAAPGMTLVGVEILSPDSRQVARSRVPAMLEAPVEGTVRISDLLMFDTSGESADNLDAAMARMIGSSRVSGKGKLGIFWEVYDLDATRTQLPVALTLTRLKGNTMERVLQTLGIVENPTPLSIRWSETPSAVATSPRSIIIDLALIPHGRYELLLAIGPDQRPLASAKRVIEVR